MTHSRSTEEKPAPHGRSFGAYKPVGYVVVAFEDDRRAGQAAQQMRAAGIAAEDIEQVSALRQSGRMEAMTEGMSRIAEFGHEAVLTRRYRELAEAGRGWLEVRVRDDDEAKRIAELARRCGALLAERYHALAVEDLI